MLDLVSRGDVLDALVEKGQSSKRYKLGEFWELNLSEIKEALDELPSVETGIIHCCDCKWWDRLEDGHPYGYCRVCRSGTYNGRWEISIFRKNRYDFYCADAEPKENEDDDE